MDSFAGGISTPSKLVWQFVLGAIISGVMLIVIFMFVPQGRFIFSNGMITFIAWIIITVLLMMLFSMPINLIAGGMFK